MTSPVERVALAFHGPGGGGAERVALTLAREFLERGLAVDLVMSHRDGPLAEEIPRAARIIDMEPSSRWSFRLAALRGPRDLILPLVLGAKPGFARRNAPPLARYLRRERPDVVVSIEPPYNLAALLASSWSGGAVPLLIVEQCDFGHYLSTMKREDQELFSPLIERLYPQAASIVAVSEGVARSLRGYARIEADKLRVIYNPIASASLTAKAAEPVDHPWFREATPVVLAVGRLQPQKDPPTLLRAFAQLRSVRPARLVILGAESDPDYRAHLEALVDELAIRSDVAFLGFVRNPFAYMARAAVLVLSSRFEGFGNVLVEAMACGTPVVSTDCPSGPAEILDEGVFGPLVPVGDEKALAEAVTRVLTDPPSASRLKQRAACFSVERATQSYLRLFEQLCTEGPRAP